MLLYAILIVLTVVSVFKKSTVESSSLSSSFTSYLKNGFKTNKKSQLYHSWFLIRRVTLVVWVLTTDDFSASLQAWVFTLIVGLNLLYLLLIRPFERVKETMTEVTNETTYIGTCCVIIYYNFSDSWTEGVSQAIIYLLIANSVLVIVIQTLPVLVSH